MVRKMLTALALALACGLVWVIFGTNHSYVSTPSMYPTIPPGSEIFYSAQDDYQVGDVIVFRANRLVWAHRLIDIKPDGTFVTKGDNPGNSPDVFIPPVTQKDVVGKVVLAPQFLGFPQLIAHDPGYGLAWLRTELGLAGRIAFVAIIGLVSLLVVTDLPKRLRRKRQNREPGPVDEADGPLHEVNPDQPAKSELAGAMVTSDDTHDSTEQSSPDTEKRAQHNRSRHRSKMD